MFWVFTPPYLLRDPATNILDHQGRKEFCKSEGLKAPHFCEIFLPSPLMN